MTKQEIQSKIAQAKKDRDSIQANIVELEKQLLTNIEPRYGDVVIFDGSKRFITLCYGKLVALKEGGYVTCSQEQNVRIHYNQGTYKVLYNVFDRKD